MNTLSMVCGMLVALSILSFVASRWLGEREFILWATRPLQQGARKKTRRMSYMDVLRAEAELIGEPEQAGLWVRLAILGSCLLLSLTVLTRAPVVLFLIPVAFAIPLITARAKRARRLQKLREQSRLAQMLIAFLMRSGALLSDTFLILEQKLDEPFKARIKEVNAKKRYATLPGALSTLAESTRVKELKDFALVVAESEQYGTPMAEALMRSLQLDTKIRDANAAKRYGHVQLQLGLYATLLIAFPGFGFVIYAMFAYMMRAFLGMPF